jgi:PAS domain-containing protein
VRKATPLEKSKSKKSLFSSLRKAGSAKDSLQAEKARLEAFLSAVPAQYCGWAKDGSVAYSPGFCEILGLTSIANLDDIKHCLSISDSAALDGLFTRLTENGISFTLNAQDPAEEKTFKISGVQGKDPMQEEIFNILWLEDITQLSYANNVFVEEQQVLHKELDRLQDSLDALPFPVWIRDEEQKIKWCNVAYAKKIDGKPSEILAEQKEIIPVSRKKKAGEQDALLGPDLARAALEKANPQTVKTHAVIGGARLLMKITEIPLKARQMTVGIAEDLTEEENLETEIKGNESANRALLEQLRSAIGIYGVDHKLSFYNSAFSQLWDLEDGWLNTKPKLGEIMEKLRETRRLARAGGFPQVQAKLAGYVYWFD